ncbi:hypothetical protein U1Q18_007287 [Sarracenia purpurea var. burkii]
MLGAGVGRPAGEVGVVGLQELRRHRRRRRHHHVDEPQPEVHERPVSPSHGGDGVVGHGPEVWEVPDHRPWLRSRRQGKRVTIKEGA